MTKSCRWCESSFEVTDWDIAFYEKVSPLIKDKRYLIPPPTLCPSCRQQRRLAFRNEMNLYNTRSARDGKEIIAVFSPDKPYKVLAYDEWWSDEIDNRNFGRDYDFSKSFFEQIQELLLSTYHMALAATNNENSPYCNLTANLKNSYMVVESSHTEDCYYSYWLQKCVSCCDTSFSHECERCYEVDNCYNCNNLSFSQDCTGSYDSMFLNNCQNCRNCFGCINLQHKEFYVFNEQKSKAEYEEFMKQVNRGSYKELMQWQQKTHRFFLKSPRKYGRILKSEDCSGDYIQSSKNCAECFHAHEAEECKYGVHVWRNSRFNMDVDTVGRDAELIYESLNTNMSAYNNAFTQQGWGSSFEYYCLGCVNSNNLFGCVNLKRNSYCILNKQYSKEQYEELVPKIIGHMQKSGEWGEFFPPYIAPFGYNESDAFDPFPMSKEQALLKGFIWSDYQRPKPQVKKIITTDQMKRLPDDIKNIPDDILDWALTCEVSGKAYRIIKQELQFYRENNLPIPRRHPDQRHKDRMALRNPRKLWPRQCDCENSTHNHAIGSADMRPLQNNKKCSNTFQSTYAPERPENVYCEECYLKEVY